MNSEPGFADFTWKKTLPASLQEARIAIWGLGLMGGSLAMALHGKTRWLAGIDLDENVCRQALEMQIVDAAGTRAEDILSEANLVILAVPLDMIPDLLHKLPALIPHAAVVMDLGSTKANILVAMQDLPARFGVIGGHPMCGKEVNSLGNASPLLYQKTSFALLALDRTSLGVQELAEELVVAAGATPVWLEAETHDRWVAAVSHLPYLAANALAAVIPVESAPLVGPGYLSTTRLASESERMMMDILVNNSENILPMLAAYRGQIEKIEAALSKSDWVTLQDLFHNGLEKHEAVLEQFRKVTGV